MLVLVIYAWAYIKDVPSIQVAMLVGDTAAILAGFTALISLTFYLWIPTKQALLSSFIVYFLLVLTVAWLVVDTGGISSPFIALWMLVATFSGVFGWLGILPLFIGILGYAILTINQAGATDSNITGILLAGALPLVVSFIIWHNKTDSVNKPKVITKDQQGTELSKITSQSETVINAIGDGLLAIDSQGVIRLINPAAQELIGWAQRDAVSLDYKSVLQLGIAGGKEITPATDPISQGLNTNQEYRSRDLELLSSSGKKISISMVVSPIGDPGSGVIVVFRDITKEKTEERQQTEFISTASHEMRTPVASIEGYLGLALNPSTAQIDSKAREYLMKAHESTQHLGHLLRDLLDVSRAEDGRLASEPKLINVAELVQSVCDGLRQKATEKGLELNFMSGSSKEGERQLSPVYYVNLDKDHLREIIDNLVENAIKYTPAGHIMINLGGDDENVTISIQDSGIGIPIEDIPHLFQKFYRVDNSDTREIGGTGLGLYLCRRLVESMNGRLWVESEYKKGSTFYISLPRLSRDEINQLERTMELQEKQPASAQPLAPATQRPLTAAQIPQQTQYTPPPAQPPTQQPQYQPILKIEVQPSVANTPLNEIEQHPEKYRYSGQTTPRARPAQPIYRNNP